MSLPQQKIYLPFRLSQVILKLQSLFLQKCILFRQEQDQTTQIRHYDYECEGIAILKSFFQKKTQNILMKAMHEMQQAGHNYTQLTGKSPKKQNLNLTEKSQKVQPSVTRRTFFNSTNTVSQRSPIKRILQLPGYDQNSSMVKENECNLQKLLLKVKKVNEQNKLMNNYSSVQQNHRKREPHHQNNRIYNQQNRPYNQQRTYAQNNNNRTYAQKNNNRTYAQKNNNRTYAQNNSRNREAYHQQNSNRDAYNSSGGYSPHSYSKHPSFQNYPTYQDPIKNQYSNEYDRQPQQRKRMTTQYESGKALPRLYKDSMHLNSQLLSVRHSRRQFILEKFNQLQNNLTSLGFPAGKTDNGLKRLGQNIRNDLVSLKDRLNRKTLNQHSIY